MPGGLSYNDGLRHAERKQVFNVHDLQRLAAESIHRSPQDLMRFQKLAEGGFNRSFLATMRDGFRFVVRVPYPITVPKYFTIASEVATMEYLRARGLPIPEVYGYSASPNNTAGAEYICMEFVEGLNLSDIWFQLQEAEIPSLMQQLVEIEAKLMFTTFPVSGSLYYTKDLEIATGISNGVASGVPLPDERFCVGPDTSLSLWYGKRSLLDLHRGPCKLPSPDSFHHWN